jgi:hypothetical protein
MQRRIQCVMCRDLQFVRHSSSARNQARRTTVMGETCAFAAVPSWGRGFAYVVTLA